MKADGMAARLASDAGMTPEARDKRFADGQGTRTSLCSLAAHRSSSVSSDSLTGVTIDQCFPTGHRWNLHQPNRNDFSEAPGSQIVVKRCPSRQRTTRFPPSLKPRSFIATDSNNRTAAPKTTTRRRRRDSLPLLITTKYGPCDTPLVLASVLSPRAARMAQLSEKSW
jgi:hypothetical protein